MYPFDYNKKIHYSYCDTCDSRCENIYPETHNPLCLPTPFQSCPRCVSFRSVSERDAALFLDMCREIQGVSSDMDLIFNPLLDIDGEQCGQAITVLKDNTIISFRSWMTSSSVDDAIEDLLESWIANLEIDSPEYNKILNKYNNFILGKKGIEAYS